MPRTSVTNAELLQAISEISRQVQARDEPLEAQLDDMRLTLTDVVRRMSTLERAVDAEMNKDAKRDSCPFRDDIVSAANNRARLKALEDKAQALEVQMVKSGMYGGAAGGGVIGILTMLLFGAGKLLGWWQ